MKVVKLVFGVLAGFWTIGVVVGFAPTLLSVDFSTRGISELASGFVAIAICGMITLWLFQSALKKDADPPSEPDDDRRS